jgi:hypothetical protein
VVLAGPRHHGEERGGATKDEDCGELGHVPTIGRNPENLLKVTSKVP